MGIIRQNNFLNGIAPYFHNQQTIVRQNHNVVAELRRIRQGDSCFRSNGLLVDEGLLADLAVVRAIICGRIRRFGNSAAAALAVWTNLATATKTIAKKGQHRCGLELCSIPQ